MPDPMRIPINNFYGGGDYTARLLIGSHKTPVNLILDTGSSTIAVQMPPYDADSDKKLKPTGYAQEILYGTGGWLGPLVTTDVAMGAPGTEITLKNAHIAIAQDQLPNNFGKADGILGLAYSGLNQAYNLTDFLQAQIVDPPNTFPWPFRMNAPTGAAYQQFLMFLEMLRTDDIPPYFDQLESMGFVTNKFAFYTRRSFPSLATSDAASDPVNQGWFILGGGEEQNDLFSGEFLDVAVLDDQFYNVNLVSVQIGDSAPVPAAPLPMQFRQTAGTNAIIDSGTNILAVSTDVWNTISSGLSEASPKFGKLIMKGQTRAGVPNAQLHLSNWPPIRFTLQGASGDNVTLSVPPESYWQLDAAKAGSALFTIANNMMPQSSIGLPLMKNYYCVFDRSADANGVIRFATIR